MRAGDLQAGIRGSVLHIADSPVNRMAWVPWRADATPRGRLTGAGFPARYETPFNRLADVAHSIYICSAEGNTGKSTVALGTVDTLSRRATRVGVFRPIARSTQERDYVLDLLLAHDGVIDLGYDEAMGVTYEDVHADPEAALATIVRRFKAVEARCEVVVIIGSDYTDVGSPTELAYNARIAANLGAPVLLTVGGRVPHGGGASERSSWASRRSRSSSS
jgi:phosphate acetyltransferase